MHAHAFDVVGPALDEPKTLVEGAYRQLRRDIIEGRHPPGEKLRVEHLKDQYQVGAGTLREALALLVSDSLVVAQGQRGFRVSPISLSDIEDITRTRVLLECEALRQSMATGDEGWEADVVSAFHRLTRAEEKLASDVEGAVNEWEERNRLFHEKLIAACPSRWTRQFLGVLYQQSERYRRISVLTRPVPRDHRARYKDGHQAAWRPHHAYLSRHPVPCRTTPGHLPAIAGGSGRKRGAPGRGGRDNTRQELNESNAYFAQPREAAGELHTCTCRMCTREPPGQHHVA